MSFTIPDNCPICSQGVKKTPNLRGEIDFDCSDEGRCFWGFYPHYFYLGLTDALFGLNDILKYDTLCYRYDVGVIDLYECRGNSPSIELPLMDLDLQDSASIQRFIKNIPKLLLL